MNKKKEHDVPDDHLLRESFSAAQRALRKSIERAEVGLDGLPAARFQLLQVFARIDRLQMSIDHAFGGQPFLPDVAATAPANTRRFNAYFQRHLQAIKLLFRALDLWMLTCGMKREDDWTPVIVEDMRQRAAAARTQDLQKSADPKSAARSDGDTAEQQLVKSALSEERIGIRTPSG